MKTQNLIAGMLAGIVVGIFLTIFIIVPLNESGWEEKVTYLNDRIDILKLQLAFQQFKVEWIPLADSVNADTFYFKIHYIPDGEVRKR